MPFIVATGGMERERKKLESLPSDLFEEIDWPARADTMK